MSGSPIPFRPVVAADLPALRRVIDTTTLFPSAMLDEMIAPSLGGNPADALWLTDTGDPPSTVAYCVREPLTDGTCNLLLIAVHEDRRGQGLGLALLRHVEAVLRARGDRLLLVDTSSHDDFAATRAFYRRAGYEEAAHIRDFYQPGDGKITFCKPLR